MAGAIPILIILAIFPIVALMGMAPLAAALGILLKMNGDEVGADSELLETNY